MFYCESLHGTPHQLKSLGNLFRFQHGDIIRLAPPLVITDEQLTVCVQIIEEAVQSMKKSH